jgi:hypothetical protein
MTGGKEEQISESREQRAVGRKQEAESREQISESREQRAVGRKQEAERGQQESNL